MRYLSLLVYSALILAPLVGPMFSVFEARSWKPLTEWERLSALFQNSALLALLACLLAVPIGTLAALALERTQLFAASAFRTLVVIALFLPLPVAAVAWQIILGSWLPPLDMLPGDVAWRPWKQGLVPAACVHAACGWPWVCLVVSTVLRTTDRGLEDEARMTGGSRAVYCYVLWPRLRLGAMLGAGVVTLQTATEIPITDAMMVRTLAEEVYTQLVSANDGLGGAVVATLLPWSCGIGLMALLLRKWSLFSLMPQADATLTRRLQHSSRWTSLAAWFVMLAVVILPIAALVWKAGGGANPQGWSAVAWLMQMAKTLQIDGVTLLQNAAECLGMSLLIVSLVWWVAWQSLRSARVARWVFALACIAIITPGPIVGMGIKSAIGFLVDAEAWVLLHTLGPIEFPPLRSMLYDQPSPVPQGWVGLVRFAPWALIMIWPAMRAVPQDLLELAKLQGADAWAEWRDVVMPFTRPAWVFAVLAVAGLLLGEVSGSKLVNPPFRNVFILRLFDQMHYGAETTVAALALWELVPIAILGGLLSRRMGR
jgi:iron(III) transport system permease protein